MFDLGTPEAFKVWKTGQEMRQQMYAEKMELAHSNGELWKLFIAVNSESEREDTIQELDRREAEWRKLSSTAKQRAQITNIFNAERDASGLPRPSPPFVQKEDAVVWAQGQTMDAEKNWQ